MANTNGLLGIWHKAIAWFDQNANTYISTAIPTAQTDMTDTGTPLAAYDGYFRLWLSEMFLKKGVSWGIERFPIVHAEVALQFANQEEVTFSRVLQPSQDVGEGVRLNYRLTELLPYNGGTVEIEAALLDTPGNDYLSTAMDVLQQFSGLVTVPLGQALTLASKLTVGTRDLLNAAQGNVHLALHQTFVSSGGGNFALSSGYHVVILATRSQLDINKLSVKNSQLYYTPKGSTKSEPLEGYDYMLFYVETRAERDDWRLPNIIESFEKARQALLDGNETKAKVYKTIALSEVWQSPDLIPNDRTRVIKALQKEWDEMQNLGLGAVGSELPDLNKIMEKHAISIANAKTLGELSAEEVFGE